MNHWIGKLFATLPALAVVAAPGLARAQSTGSPQPPSGYETVPPTQPAYPQPQGYPQQQSYPQQQGYPPEYPPPPGPGYGYGPPVEQAPIGPQRMDYSEGDPVPPGYRVTTSARKGWVVGGFVTFGSLWFISALTAAIADSAKTEANLIPLYVPVAGPFITMATAKSEGIGTFTLALDGLGQTSMLALGIAGILLPKSELVRNDIAFMKNVQVAPIVNGTGLGLGLRGEL